MKKKINAGDAAVDSLYKERGKVYHQGSVAHRLLANNFNVNALRTNDTLLYDEWKHIDTAILKEANIRLSGVNFLVGRGLTYNIPNGMGKTVLAWQDASDTEDAEVSMDGLTKARRDRPEFDIGYLPLPIIHKDFSFSAREIAESRNGNMPLDTTMAELATRKVSEKIEEFLVIGSSTYTFGGGTIRGLLDHGDRNTGSLTANWDDSAGTGEAILSDTLAMKQALIDDRHYGPYALWLPTNFETAIDEDFKSNSDRSIRERISMVENLVDIRVVDKMTADNVVMFQLTPDVVRMVIGLAITVVEWESEGGMRRNFKIIAIMVPQIRSTQANRSGIAHWS